MTQGHDNRPTACDVPLPAAQGPVSLQLGQKLLGVGSKMGSKYCPSEGGLEKEL